MDEREGGREETRDYRLIQDLTNPCLAFFFFFLFRTQTNSAGIIEFSLLLFKELTFYSIRCVLWESQDLGGLRLPSSKTKDQEEEAP